MFLLVKNCYTAVWYFALICFRQGQNVPLVVEESTTWTVWLDYSIFPSRKQTEKSPNNGNGFFLSLLLATERNL